MPSSSVLCDSYVSSLDTFYTSTSNAHFSSKGTNQLEGILGSHPNTISQIYHAIGHCAGACPSYAVTKVLSSPQAAPISSFGPASGHKSWCGGLYSPFSTPY